jgi:uncharacterized protein
MGLVPHESAVQELAAASADPAFGPACHGGQRRTAERLLASGADPDATPGYSDQTAAQSAAAPGTQRENLIAWLQDRSQ